MVEASPLVVTSVCRHPWRYRAIVIWVFVAIAAVLVFAVAAATVGREAFRLGHQPPPTIFDLDEAVLVVADALPVDVQGRLRYDDVSALIRFELDHLQAKGLLALPGDELAPDGPEDVVVADDDAVAVALGAAEEAGLDVADDDVYLVISELHVHLEQIGAIGPQAAIGPRAGREPGEAPPPDAPSGNGSAGDRSTGNGSAGDRSLGGTSADDGPHDEH